jgi:hypothetical protein
MWAAIKGTIERSNAEFCLDEQKIAASDILQLLIITLHR